MLLALLMMLAAGVAEAKSNSLVVKRLYGGGGASSSAKLKYDYIELFNAGPVAVNLANFTIQYSGGTSALGFTSASSIALPNFMLQPGQYYLIRGFSGGLGGVDLSVTPDYIPTGSLSGGAVPDISSSNGKVAIVYGSGLLPNCSTVTNYLAPPVDPPPTSSNLIDFVGFGNATNGSAIVANCAEGRYPGPNISTTRALLRSNSCGDTDVNVNDFTSDTANNAQPQHNASSALEPCFGSGTTMPVLNGGMSPSVVSPGGQSLLAISVTPGSNPPMQSQTITANLAALGGSSTQVLYDDGTHGDAVAGDSVFSFMVSAGPTVGTYIVPVTYIDDAFRQVNFSTQLEIAGGIPQTVAIHDIQANVPSTYAGQTLSAGGIVTGTTAGGFYIQAKNSDADFNDATPEGIFVSLSPLPAQAAVGNEVIVTGKVVSGVTNTIGSSPSVMLVSTGNTVPTSVLIDASDLVLNGPLDQLRKYQGMRVKFDSLTTISGSGGAIDAVNAKGTGNGTVYAVITGMSRPFREPGISVADTLPSGAPSNVPRFDGNPERLVVDFVARGGTLTNVTANTQLTGVYAILEMSSGRPTVLVDPGQLIGISTQMSAPPAALPMANEVTVAGAALGNLYNATNDGNSAPLATSSAYAARLMKISLAFRTLLNSPDVIGVAEIENLSTLQDVAQHLNSDSIAAGLPDPQYQGYLQQSNVPGSNMGFLVKSSRINVAGFDVFGQSNTYTDPITASQQLLFPIPPAVLHAGVKRVGQSDYPLTIVANVLVPMDNISGDAGAGVRAQRAGQAEYVANLVQSFQSAGENVIVAGGFNAYQFNDGYVDVFNTIKGTPASPDQVVRATTAELVSPALVALDDSVDPSQRYSEVDQGNAVALNHMLVTSNLASSARFQFMHSNADFPVSLYGDPNRPEGIADNDMMIAYFTVPGNVALPGATVGQTTIDFGIRPVNATATLSTTLTNSGAAALTISSILVDLPDFVQSNNCGQSLAPGASCTITISFTPAELKQYCGTLTITTNASATQQKVSLMGTGANVVAPVADNQSLTTPVDAPASVTLTASNSPTSFAITSNPANGTLSCAGAICTYTPNPKFAGSDSFSFTATNAAGTSAPATVSITVAKPVAATLTAPTTGTMLSGKTAMFTWTPGTLVSKYMLFVGTMPGTPDDFYSGEVTTTSLNINGLRSTDGNIYVRLYSWIPSLNGWQYNDYVFAYSSPQKAALISPTGSLTSRSATFTWTPGNMVTKYMLFVGTAPATADDFYSGEVTTTSLNVNGLRSTDGNIYVRLYSWYENGWHYNDYTFSYTPPVQPVAATLTAPSSISGTTAEFTWTAGTAIDHYMLCVGTQPGGTDNYYSGPTTSTDVVVNGMRTIDGNVYVRLYSWATDHWLWKDYVFPVQ